MSTEATATLKEVKSGVRYIIDNLKYPDYIRNHGVFQKLSKVSKVFPSIGLPNVQEECDYNNVPDAKADAQNLLITDVRTALYKVMDSYGCKQPIRTLASDFYNHLSNYYPQMIVEEEGRINIKFTLDCGIWDGKPFVKKGEGFFKAYNKLVEKCKEEAGINLAALETMQYFKSFSSSNVGGKKYKLIFSSVGEEGAWDIATISMRGINSCQTWGTPQSRGLIGSISSRYVGVIYITSGEKFNEYGPRMIRRRLVRFAINRKTKKPGLLLDRVYPADFPNARKIFKEFLTKRTGLPVLFSGESGWGDYELPIDSYWKFVTMAQGDYTYMDTKIPWMPAKSPPPPKDPYTYYNRLLQLDHDLRTRIHNAISKMADEYVDTKKEHKELFKGGIVNLFVSMRKHLGGGAYITTSLPRLYDYAVNNAAWLPQVNDCENPAEYERQAIRAAFKQLKTIETAIKANYSRMGKWTKFYPKSIEKLVAIIIDQYKKELIVAYKNLLKN
jgi:hypothetical protein